MDVFVDPPDCVTGYHAHIVLCARSTFQTKPVTTLDPAPHISPSVSLAPPAPIRSPNHAHTIHHSPPGGAAAAVNLAGPFRWHRPAAQTAKRISRAAAQYSSAAPHRTPLLFSTPRNNNRRATEARTAWSSPHGSTGALSRVTGVCSCGRTKRPRSGTREGVALREGASERLLRSAAKYFGPRTSSRGPRVSLAGAARAQPRATASTHQRPLGLRAPDTTIRERAIPRGEPLIPPEPVACCLRCLHTLARSFLLAWLRWLPRLKRSTRFSLTRPCRHSHRSMTRCDLGSLCPLTTLPTALA